MPPLNQNSDSGTNVYPPAPGQPTAPFDPTQPMQLPKKSLNTLMIPFILTLVFLLFTIGFAFWAFTQMQEYKNKSDQKSAQAVSLAEKKLEAKKEAEFAEREKNPFKEYRGSATFGSVVIQYPKTWSAYITESDRGTVPIDGYMHPNYVPGLQTETAFALRFQVSNTSYDQELKKYDSDAKSGKVKVSPASAPKVPNVAGVKIEGEVERGKRGTVVLFPVRDKTLRIITESEQFNKDFNDIILANLVFVP